MGVLAPRSRAPEFALESTAGGPVGLEQLRAGGPVLLVFAAEECPTSQLALRRLGPLAGPLRETGVALVAVFEDPPEVAARVARRTGFAGTVLSEPPPYDVSGAYGLESLPTSVLVDPGGEVVRGVTGWDADALEELLAAAGAPALGVGDEEPRRKPGCVAKNTLDAETQAMLQGGADELEEMFARGWTDGLPVVPPTPERVAAMLGGRDGARSLGEVPPAMGEATLERVAACAVLAGCRPDYFPVVVAAVEAALDPAFNLHGQAVTTQPAGQLVVVNGPARDALGLNSGIGVLGPGWRANLTIGRALRLVVTLTGGGMPGRLDRAALGHPGKLSFCIAEDEESSPWEPLHVERGFDPASTVVTLIASDAPQSISEHRSKTPEELAWVLGWASAGAWTPGWWPLGATSVYVIGGEHQRMFGDAGWSKQRLRETLFEVVRRPARELATFGETTPRVAQAGPDEIIPRWTSPDEIVFLAAGGEAGRYSALLGPCLGMESQVVSKEVRWTT
jgi:peroxiredoxin